MLPNPKMKKRLWPLLLACAYVLLIYFLGGLKLRHIAIASLSILDLYNEKTRSFLKHFFPFMLTGIAYDSMRYYYWWGIEGHIRVAEPYLIEKALFGIKWKDKILTPNEFFEIYTSKVLDFFCGLAYLTFVFEYLATGFALFFKNKMQLLRVFGWCFFLVNIMGFATYYIYPAAPPWYITLYGFGPAKMYIPSSTAAASRFDALFGSHFFDGMYGQSVDIYGAIPSLHVSYPFLVAWVSMVIGKFQIPAIAFYFLMCFSAVYLQHHYIIDVILGTAYALVALAITSLYCRYKRS